MRTESMILIVFALAVITMACILLIVFLFAVWDTKPEQATTQWWDDPQGQQRRKVGWLPVLALLVAMVGALAGLLQVPEVRIFLGLDPRPVHHNENKSVQPRLE